MGLREVLSKMKIVEMDDEPAVALPSNPSNPPDFAPPPGLPGSPGLQPPPPGSAADIQALLGSLEPPREVDERALARASGGGGEGKGGKGGKEGQGGGGVGEGGEIPDFAAVFAAAGIKDPLHGYSAYKVLEILSSPEFANLESKAKAAALSGFLKMNPSGPVPITDVVQDAVRRDQALDKFEDFLRTKLKGRTEQIEKENRDLQAEIDALALRNREKMEANRKTLAVEEERFARWQVTKRIEERKLFDAVSPFVETNPISTGPAGEPRPAAPRPGSDSPA